MQNLFLQLIDLKEAEGGGMVEGLFGIGYSIIEHF